MLTDNVLDTLKIINSKILHKEHHIDRTYEAFLHLKKNISRNDLIKIYAEIETQFQNENVRVVFTLAAPLRYTAQPYTPDSLQIPVRLQASWANMPSSQFKWENRHHWQQLLNKRYESADDVLLLTSNGYLRETCRFNLFAYDKKNDCYLTPKLDTGCINGAFRRHCLQNKLDEKVLVEKNISLIEVAQYELYVGNSVRGLLKAVLLNY